VSPVKYELGFYIPEDGTLHQEGMLVAHFEEGSQLICTER
jgi:hypothetical protein